MRGLVACLAVLGCGKGSQVAGGGSALSGSAVATADAGVAAPPAKLLFADKDQPIELEIAFDHHVPVLPAVSADGAWLASFDSDAMTGPMAPNPVFLSIERIDGTGTAERIQIVDLKLASDGFENSWDQKPPPAPIAKQVRDNGKAVIARLHDFGSLVKVDVDTNNGDPKPAKIGDLVLASTIKSDALTITLADASGKVFRHERIKSFNSDEKPASFAGGSCFYSPTFRDAYTDQAKQKLYLFLAFRFNEECTPQTVQMIEWPLSKTAPVSNVDALDDLVTGQFDLYGTTTPDSILTADAQLVFGSDVSTREHLPFHAVAPKEQYSGHDDDDVDVHVARDGKSAWGSATTKITLLPTNQPNRDDPWRASSMFVKTPAGWRIAASTWSRPVANAKANKDAKAGMKSSPPFPGDPGDAALRAAFAKLVTDGVDAEAIASKDLVAIGSADGERTVGGKTFAAGWNAGWKGRATVLSSIAHVAPSTTTGWVAANVELAKTGYKIPFHVFCVFDKTAAGAWSLVHIHFSI